MSYLANKLKAKSSQYARRKIRTNTQVKNGTDGVRVIVSRSNKFVSAQAVDTAGNVVASISDKGQK
jgi:ribosomal protein L18